MRLARPPLGLLNAVIAASFVLPLFFWYRGTGPLALYVSAGVPPGQFAYVLSKLFGLLALTGLVWQVFLALMAGLRLLDPVRLRGWHRGLGCLVLVLVLAHFFSFFLAASLRQDSAAWGLWLPNFQDYYHTRLTLGLLALWALIAVIVAGISRAVWQARWAVYLHRVYWLAIGLGFTHGLAVGSEFQSGFGLIFFSLLVGSALGLVLWRRLAAFAHVARGVSP